VNYGQLIKDAFWITLRNRYLWFFGFFVDGMGLNFNVPAGGGGEDFDDGFNAGQAGSSSPFAGQIGVDPSGAVALFLGVIAVVLLIALVFVMLAVISTGGLADSVAAIDRGEGRRFSSTFMAGLSNFWRVLGMSILFALIGVALFP